MSLKNSTTTADYIDFDRASNVASKLLKEPKTVLIGKYIIIAMNTGLRCSDILALTCEQLKQPSVTITEGKTEKKKTFAVNDAIRAIVPADATGGLFITQKGGIISIQHLNRLLKDAFAKESKTLNISSHSLRKSFGRRVFFNNGESEKALVYLSDLFNHSSIAVTRKYLGIRQDELNDIYLNL
ncbi:tyrosine-type recombinase/integrase [Flavobacterium muglaense]|uniref:Tyrosine-type recombinase/integrase n=1 Tax=Flavobacterium muglaense TaxID=2764716 RepID=A0A923MWY2_9FLAO|nr:tyrosine-type recombinase/integrase [Flavobacterium muglaense]MBC5836774.1 tyrosine-type recombinase/integrase [Flavobacterium muglaense]MBC5843276.1 tyrosine-type recombinase/integrase [Flavobacterium muglaense]